ncbi:amidohydrolase family protein [Luteimonas sp. Y-2-2-4F]|nr:amidohydrolase family protein [Luteimonas sp. Y-2-2-4F]MCD9032897.1 amidohydrolase family protein [Luteimonas sp. Y-2-2-4F]
MRHRLLAAVAAAAIPAAVAASQAPGGQEPVTVLHAGAVLASPGEPPLGPQTIVVRGDRIEALHPGFRPATEFGPDTRKVDLSRAFLLPGLIDLHVHLAIDANADAATSHSPERLALSAAGYAARLLHAGVTTVRDVGDNSGVTLALRDAFARNVLPGPRVFAAGRVVSRSGGHGARRPRQNEVPYAPAACDGPESCRRAVRENVEQGVDWIKLTVSGSGRESGGRADAAPIMFEDEVAAASAAASQAQRPVAAHAYSPAAIRLALASGARTIEHGTYFDDETAALFRRTGAFLVPTAYVAHFVRTRLDFFAGGTDGRDAEDLRAWSDAAAQTPGRAWRAGIRLALGTDGGPSFPTDATAREVGHYVEAGVPASEAIRAATANGAEALGLGDVLGRVSPGYLADLIAVERSPIERPEALREVVFVMKDGIIRTSCGPDARGCAPRGDDEAPGRE